MECDNCRATSTTKEYPGKVGTLCIPCWNRRVTRFQEDASDEFNRKWEERTMRWGRLIGIALFYLVVLAIILGVLYTWYAWPW